MTFDHVFDKVIFDVLISFLTIFNVVMVYKFFDVLFAFHCCDFRSSDPFPLFQSKTKINTVDTIYRLCVVRLFFASKFLKREEKFTYFFDKNGKSYSKQILNR
jgi:hypothetical protein